MPKLLNYAKLCQNCEVLWDYAKFFELWQGFRILPKLCWSYAKVIQFSQNFAEIFPSYAKTM
jgi:hypothetical protein